MERSVKKSEYVATIYDGHSHIERRVYVDDIGNRFVKINGFLFNADFDLPNYDVKIWYNGYGSIY